VGNSPRRSFGRQSLRRRTSWVVGPTASNISMSSGSQVLWTTGVGQLVDGETLVRVRGVASVFLNSFTAAGDGFFGAMGIAITTDEAFASGAGAVPSPLNDVDWDGWLWHSFFDVRGVSGTIGDGVNANAVYQRIEIDSKAMRKWKAGTTLFGIVDQIESGTAIAEVNADCRILVKLP